jgi:hypothetical protein
MSTLHKTDHVIALLEEERVATMPVLRSRLGVCHMTVLRALRDYGYYRSCDHNGRYYTLIDIPVFDGNGLWAYGDVRFSKWGTLLETIVALVEASAHGLTRSELGTRLGTRVRNQLSGLCRAGRVRSFRVGRAAVYVSGDAERRAVQEAPWREQERQRRAEARRWDWWQEGKVRVPEGMDVLAVLGVLVGLNETPEATVASLSKRLQGKGVQVRAKDVRRVIEFYSLEKKTAR